MNLIRVLLQATASRAALDVMVGDSPQLPGRPPRKPRAAPPGVLPDRPDPLITGELLGPARDLLPPGLKQLYDSLERGTEQDVLEIFHEMERADQSRAIESALRGLPPAQLEDVHTVLRAQLQRPWIPNPGPQTWALHTKAEIIGFGGAAGGGKTDLMCALAGMHHTRSLILRREGTQLTSLVDRFNEIFSGHGNFVSQPVRRFNFKDPADRTVIFGHCKEPDDWMAYQGQPRDFLGLDESTQFLESQIHMLMAWVRTTKRNQRTRILFATNPPTGAEGYWFYDMFAPWLAEDWKGGRPAPGEPMWFIRVGKDYRWLDDPDMDDAGNPVELVIEGEKYFPRSCTFIPSKLDDNPYLVRTPQYRATLQSLEEPMRSLLLHGSFKQLTQDDPWQVIPSAWVAEAVKRWEDSQGRPPSGVAMTAIGVDIAQGGRDNTVLAPRYDAWFAPLSVHEGVVTTDGPAVAGLVFSVIRDGATLTIDLGGGWGGSAFDHLKNNMNVPIFGVRGGDPSEAKTPDGTGFFNTRTEMWWKFREALDPNYGLNIALPPHKGLERDLTTPRFKWSSGVIQVEAKDAIVKRLGRSTDFGDAVVMSWRNGHKSEDQTVRRRAKPLPKQALVGHKQSKRR